MANMLEPIHYIRLCLDRELTQEEFDIIGDTIIDAAGDLLEDTEVIMHERDGQYCYIFTLIDDITTADDGTSLGDSISAEIDGILGNSAQWELEGSLPDQEIEVPDTATEAQIQETAIQHFRTLLRG